ncbi:hypothetical protein E3E38_01965 [Thermococcus sp. 18S1]|uniref:hypothetical protein n=1 Tax=Thermococcus sp. 18S1 TaxID=1638210 RepID=UPI00143C22F7|nr:hypothetical protein [Thermococcus sp. 18S1]NJE29820.1 hypothetical protein [Thermococcus sp. 18S1]
MRGILAVGVLLMLIVSTASGVEARSAEIIPYVYEPTVPDTAFSVLAFYENGDYARVLEGCEWLMILKTPFDSWGFAHGEEHEAKYTAMAMMALMRGERVARGRYNSTLNSAAYWLIYTQNPDGSWGDYTDTALAFLALREFLDGGYVDSRLRGLEKQIEEALSRAQGWLMVAEPKSDADRIFGYMALGKTDELHDMKVSGEMEAYRAFALAYLGSKIELSGDFNSTVAIAMALYATGDERYMRELIEREHFGFWGVLHYRVLDLLAVSKIQGFGELRTAACPYLDRLKPTTDFEGVVLADYYMTCNKTPPLPSNYSNLLPWQVAELARIKAALGKDYRDEVSYLISTGNAGVWKDFYNTAYVIWVFKGLNVSYNYSPSLRYLRENLTWMLETENLKTGNPIYYNVPTYYFAYALMVFRDFRMNEELNRTLDVLEERQYENGAFPYTQGSVAGITSTARAVWALQEAGLTEMKLYRRGVTFLKNLLYTRIQEPTVDEGTAKLANATFILVKNGKYAGNTTEMASISGVDGYVVIYPSKSPLEIRAYPVEGFTSAEPAQEERTTAYAYIVAGALLIALAVVIVRRKKKGR